MTNAKDALVAALVAMSLLMVTVGDTVTSVVVTIGYPAALSLSSVARRFGTENPRWFTVVPFDPPVGAIACMKISTFGNLTTSRLPVPTFAMLAPSVSTQ